MTYSLVIPFRGYAGWAFLARTQETQRAAFAASASVQTTEQYFRDNISKIETAEQLVADRRLLDVALNAFGLGEDINNRFFIQKVLEEGTLKEESFANRLSDKRYLALSKAFGFGDSATPQTKLAQFTDGIIAAYRDRKFEVAVGDIDENMRVALSLQRELPALAAQESSVNTKWFSIIGSPPLSRAFQTALGLPSTVGALDIDQQVGIFKDKAEAMFGSADPTQFRNPETIDKLVKSFLLRSELSVSATGSGSSVALQILQANQGRLGLRL